MKSISDKNDLFLSKIMDSGKKLLEMVDQYLELGVDSGNLILSKTPVKPADLIEEAIADVALPAGEKQITIAKDVDPGVPSVQVDKARMLRVLINLLSNAIKYTQSGGVVGIKAEVGPSGRRGSIEISVSDNGPGIPEQDIPRIFDKFYRSSATSGIKGTGLGLAVVKSIVEAHGGYVAVETSLGKGSTFRLWIPTGETSDREVEARVPML